MIIYTLNKTQDDFVLEVSQITTYNLYYTSDKSNSIVETKTVEANTSTVLPADKDGHYRLELIADGEANVEVEFDVIKYLQNSITIDALSLICGTDLSGCVDGASATCLTKYGKECLQHKAVFVKLLTFQTLHLPTYGSNTTLAFLSYVQNGANSYNCKLQTTINRILQEECVTGSASDTSKLFKMYLAIYWAGMYFIEEQLAGNNADQLAFVKTKFYYDSIIGCLCGLCIDIDELKDGFEPNPSFTTITSFQYADALSDIDDIALLTPQYLLDNGEVQVVDDLEAGKEIIFTGVGRLGFVLENSTQGAYKIYDILGNEITSTVFDTSYNPTTFTEYFVSKALYTPSTIYFKFVKQ